jgi:hypothetical protein
MSWNICFIGTRSEINAQIEGSLDWPAEAKDLAKAMLNRFPPLESGEDDFVSLIGSGHFDGYSQQVGFTVVRSRSGKDSCAPCNAASVS